MDCSSQDPSFSVKNKDKNKLAKQREVTKTAQQMCFLIGLLSLAGVEVVLKKRNKPSIKSKQIPDVYELRGKIVYSHEQILSGIQEKTNRVVNENTNPASTKRNFSKNKESIVFNLMKDIIIRLCGDNVIFTDKKTTRKPEVTIKKERFNSIIINGMLLSEKDIIKIGDQLYNVIDNILRTKMRRRIQVDKSIISLVDIESYNDCLLRILCNNQITTISQNTLYWLSKQIKQ
ncbi:Uncharacterized protein QTN25_000351 [Entamoeba marina]